MSQPSLKQLIDRAKTAIVNETGQSNKATDAIASAIAGASYGQYAHQDLLFQQLNPETASEEWLYLWATRLDTARISATNATGTVTFNLTAGVVNVPQGVIIKTADDKEYQTTQATNSDQPIAVQAVDAGTAQNLTAGVNLYLVTAVTGLNPESITTIDISGGAEIEDLQHWRERIITDYNEKQAIGTTTDYTMWAKASHTDIDYAWALDNNPTTGHVKVYVGQQENDPKVSDGVKLICQNYMEENRLAGCHITVQHPTTKAINLTLSGVTDVTTRDNITTAIQNYLKTRLGDQQPITPGEIVVAITTITTNFGIVSPTTNTTVDETEVITLGVITWQ